VASILADNYWAGSLLTEILMILFTQSTAVLHKHLNDELKILCLLQLSLRLHGIPWQFPEFSTFREIPEYSRFSRFVATLPQREQHKGTARLPVLSDLPTHTLGHYPKQNGKSHVHCTSITLKHSGQEQSDPTVQQWISCSHPPVPSTSEIFQMPLGHDEAESVAGTRLPFPLTCDMTGIHTHNNLHDIQTTSLWMLTKQYSDIQIQIC